MLAAQFSTFGRPQDVIELVELPEYGDPGPDEVIINTELFPINPADLLNFAGLYGASKPTLPMIPGVEGVGRVASIGSNVHHVKPGDRVLLPPPGVWCAHIKTAAQRVFTLPEEVDPQQLAMLQVNPAAAWILLHDFVKPTPGQWLIQNAANSGVGHCMIRMARDAGVKTINVVRRDELIKPLLEAGGDVVLVDNPELDAQVRDAVGDGILPLAIDAVGGAATQRLARCLAEGGTLVNYGVMSGEPSIIDAGLLVFRDISIRGFWLRRWIKETPPERIGALYRELAKQAGDGRLHVEVEAVYPIRQIRDALAHAAKPARRGKILVSFPE